MFPKEVYAVLRVLAPMPMRTPILDQFKTPVPEIGKLGANIQPAIPHNKPIRIDLPKRLQHPQFAVVRRDISHNFVNILRIFPSQSALPSSLI